MNDYKFLLVSMNFTKIIKFNDCQYLFVNGVSYGYSLLYDYQYSLISVKFIKIIKWIIINILL